jgi:AraC-like DNA-binding protein
MAYGEGIAFDFYNHIPRCEARIDREFGDFAINLCVSGRLYYAFEGGPREVLAGPVFWWTWPGPRFEYGALPGEHWNHYYLTFTGARAEYLKETGVLPERDRAYYLLERADAVQQAFVELMGALSRPQSDMHDVAANLLDRVCLLARMSEQQPQPPDERTLRLDELASDIASEPEREWSAEQMAERVGVSTGHLRRLFAERFDISPYQYVIDVRMQRAAEMLRSSDAAVKEIAAAVGVDDLAYFTRLFKARFGYPPARYRLASLLREAPE